jgi:hypothetical protein
MNELPAYPPSQNRARRRFRFEAGNHAKRVMAKTAISSRRFLWSAHQASALTGTSTYLPWQSSLWPGAIAMAGTSLRFLARHCDVDHDFDGWARYDSIVRRIRLAD